MTHPAEHKYTIPCGRLYDPGTDSANDLFLCDSWARWEIVDRRGFYHYACGSHINKVLADLVGDKRKELVVKDLRTL